MIFKKKEDKQPEDTSKEAHRQAEIQRAMKFFQNAESVPVLLGRIEQLEKRVTWIEQLLMREGREIDFTTTSSDWRSKDV